MCYTVVLCTVLFIHLHIIKIYVIMQIILIESYLCFMFLQMLLAFLQKVVACQKNKMNITNVAMIIAPNLFLVASSKYQSYRGIASFDVTNFFYSSYKCTL